MLVLFPFFIIIELVKVGVFCVRQHTTSRTQLKSIYVILVTLINLGNNSGDIFFIFRLGDMDTLDVCLIDVRENGRLC